MREEHARQVLSGVLPADGGRLSVLGRATLTPHEARAIDVATVFQEVLVADECSVIDNLFMGADRLFSSSMSGSAKMRTAQALMRELVGAPVDVRALAGTLPLGFKQWITIGRALLRNPRILILDESSAAFDLDSTERLFAKMHQLRDAGSTVLIVTHRIAEFIRTLASFSAWVFLGQGEMVAREGLPFAETAFGAITIPLAGVLFMKRQWMLAKRFGYVTPAEMLGDYFESEAIRVLVLILALLFAVPFMGLQLAATARLIGTLSD